jgi:hypothetical protein
LWRNEVSIPIKTTSGPAYVVPQIAANNCDQALLADYTLSNNRDPPWFSARTRSWATFIHTNTSFQQIGSCRCNPIGFVVFVPSTFLSGNCVAKFPKIFRKSEKNSL